MVINASEVKRIKTPVGYLVVDVRDMNTVSVTISHPTPEGVGLKALTD